ncbi:COG4315 family predicted lipoprotein [Microbacterium karelineae]|uniref:COG4315 family predicted lipoprotein n=1 Tax=Microbacterium karelineae TaxID=2654283 RepID=UPI001E65BD5D|nr:hypothetical protein [Microbacterium karelineae]
MMSIARTAAAGAAIALALGLAGCGDASGTSGTPGGGYGAPAEEEPMEEPMEDPQATSLATAETDLGEIVVDGEGLTVYMFDQDVQGSGESTCEGDCLDNWPPVTTDADATDVDVAGVTGEVGTITGTDGSTQLTLDGWPLYYFAGDAAPGDVTGQAVGEIWWVMAPDGSVIRD